VIVSVSVCLCVQHMCVCSMALGLSDLFVCVWSCVYVCVCVCVCVCSTCAYAAWHLGEVTSAAALVVTNASNTFVRCVSVRCSALHSVVAC